MPIALPAHKALLLGGVPSWVLDPGVVPLIDMDFRRALYFGLTPSGLTCTRASQGTDLLPTSASGASFNTYANLIPRISPGVGLIPEESRTNNLLNSTVPITQTTASLGAATYTLWVNGSGTATPSAGTATITGAAAASQGSPNTFTVTVAGTVVITVAGSLSAFQLETGSFPTSLIVTAGVTANRAQDAIMLPSALFASFAQGSVCLEWGGPLGYGPITGTRNNRDVFCARQDGNNQIRLCVADANAASSPPQGVRSVGGTGVALTATNPVVAATTYKMAMSWDAVGTRAAFTSSLKSGLATDSTALGGINPTAGIRLGSNPGGGEEVNEILRRFTYWPSSLPGAALQALVAS